MKVILTFTNRKGKEVFNILRQKYNQSEDISLETLCKMAILQEVKVKDFPHNQPLHSNSKDQCTFSAKDVKTIRECFGPIFF